MTQDLTGGYCPKCNTVWASPGVCKCEDHITYSDSEFPIPTFHCSVCWEATEGFSICLKCNPQRYEVVGIEKAFSASTEAYSVEHNDKQDRIDKSLAKQLATSIQINTKLKLQQKEIWNKAIEAAAKVDALGMNKYLAQEIRKLKK